MASTRPEDRERESLIEYEPNPESKPIAEWNKANNLAGKKKMALPPIESKPDTQSLLKAILPPREWEQDGKHFVQYVSHNKASRDDVTKLQANLDQRLLSRQARESGICPIREELHNQCFDEIIRQVTIDCPERGLLLMRVRDELKMTIAAYQTLYKSAVAFGMRKQIQAEKGKKDFEEKIATLEDKRKMLIDRKSELENKKKAIESRIAERKDKEKNRRNEELKFLEFQFSNLRKFFDNLGTEKGL